jgi:hypothetical protein
MSDERTTFGAPTELAARLVSLGHLLTGALPQGSTTQERQRRSCSKRPIGDVHPSQRVHALTCAPDAVICRRGRSRASSADLVVIPQSALCARDRAATTAVLNLRVRLIGWFLLIHRLVAILLISLVTTENAKS